jgi:hypothetical protein
VQADNEDFTGMPNPADVEATLQAASGDEAAHEWLAQHGVTKEGAMMIAVDDTAPGDVFQLSDAEPEWIAIPVYQAGEFTDLVLMHRNNPRSFHTVTGRACWLGAENTGNAR